MMPDHIPTLDIDKAILDPAKYFERPKDVLVNDNLSLRQKKRILQQWRYDAKLLMTAEAENMGGGEKFDIADVDRALEIADIQDKSDQNHAEDILKKIDGALQRSPTISQKQFTDLNDLRIEILQHCKDRNRDKAERCADLAITLIAAGAPAKE